MSPGEPSNRKGIGTSAESVRIPRGQKRSRPINAGEIDGRAVAEKTGRKEKKQVTRLSPLCFAARWRKKKARKNSNVSREERLKGPFVLEVGIIN